MSRLPVSPLRSWRDTCVTIYFSSFFLFWRNPAVLWPRTSDTWVIFRSCPIWQDNIVQAEDVLTFSPAVFRVFMLQEALDCPILSTLDIFLLVPTMCSLLNHLEPNSQGLLHALSNWSTVVVQYNWSQLTHPRAPISIAQHVDNLMYFRLGNLPNKIILRMQCCWNTAFISAT